LTREATDLIFKLCTSAENRLGAEGIKSHAFFHNFDFGPKLRRSKAPYVPPLSHATDTSNFEPIDEAIIADRKAKRDMARQRQQLMNPTATGRHQYDQANGNNVMNMYEFTFRRFVDDAYSTENINRYSFNNEMKDSTTTTATTTAEIDGADEVAHFAGGGLADQSAGFKMLIKSIREPAKNFENSENTDLMDTTGSMSLNDMNSKNAITANKHFDQNSLSYQTEMLIDNTRKIQLKESTNSTVNANGSSSFFNNNAASFNGYTLDDGEANNENLNTIMQTNAASNNSRDAKESFGSASVSVTPKQPPVYI
jgi:hypothetical protein